MTRQTLLPSFRILLCDEQRWIAKLSLFDVSPALTVQRVHQVHYWIAHNPTSQQMWSQLLRQLHMMKGQDRWSQREG
jgi:hypothetical protein